MASSRLIALPPELKREIVGYMLRASDMKTLCLTCKDLWQFATPVLYRTVHIHLWGGVPKWIGAFVNFANHGRQYIRELQLSGGRPSDLARSHVVQQIIRTILSSLSPNTLDAFCALLLDELDCGSTLLLFQTQRTLRKLGLPRRITGDLAVTLDDFPWVVPDLIRLHTVEFETESTLGEKNRLAQRLSKRLLNLRHLRIDGLMYDEDFDVVGAIDPCWKVPGPSILSQLSSLKLHDIDLTLEDRPYPLATKLVALETLHLEGCLKSDVLLDWMVIEICRLRRRRFALRDFKYSQSHAEEDHSPNVLSQFLGSFSGLRYLCIDVHEAVPLPAVDSLIKHSESLSSLMVSRRLYELDDGNHGDIHYSVEDLSKLCTACTNLEQIAIGLPLFSNYSWSRRDIKWQKYQKFIHAISLLLRAHTVRILTWPSLPEDWNGCFIGSSEYFDHFIHDLATIIFQKLDGCKDRARCRSPVRVLSFDPLSMEESCLDMGFEDGYEPQIFVRGQQNDPFGNSKTVAVSVTQPWKFVLPESTILQHHDRF